MKYSTIVLCLIIIATSCTQFEDQHNQNAEAPVKPNSKLAKGTELRSTVEADKTYEWKNGAQGASVRFDHSANAQNTPDAPQPNLVGDRRLIWNADLEFEVEHLDRSFQEIRRLCKRHEGFISDMEQTNESRSSSMVLNIRVANEQFHDLVASIKGQSKKLDAAVITSDDVTEEFVDIENRLETKRKARERYIEILRSKTGTIEEVIQAEEAIRRITEEIEAKEGRLRYLSDRIDFSTIDIRMYKKVTYNPPVVAQAPTFGDKAKSSFSSGWEAIKSMGLFLITIWPLLLITTLLLIWKRTWIREKLAFVRAKITH